MFMIKAICEVLSAHGEALPNELKNSRVVFQSFRTCQSDDNKQWAVSLLTSLRIFHLVRDKDFGNMALMRPIIPLVVVQLHIANWLMMMHIAAFVGALLDLHLVKAGIVETFREVWGAVDVSRYPPFLMDEMLCREQQKPISLPLTD